MKNRKSIGIRIITGLVGFALVVSLGACSSGKSGGGMAMNESAPAPAMAPAPSAPMMASGMAAADMDFNRTYPEELEKMARDEAGGGGYGSDVSAVQSGRKITFRADMSINTKSFDADYRVINDMIVQAGGYVASENMYDNSYYNRNAGRYVYLSARIPAAGYDSFLERLGSVGDVVGRNKSSDDLTSQYYDTEARIEMLEIRKERLMKYLVEAENAADIVEFERELSYVLFDLDNYQGSKRRLDQLVEYATVDVNLNEIITPETIGKDGEPLGTRASDAFGLSVSGVGRFLQGFVVFLAGAVPVIILLAVIALIIWLLVRLSRKIRGKIHGPEWNAARQERKNEKRQRKFEKIQNKYHRHDE